MTQVDGLTMSFQADAPGRMPLLLVHGFLSSRNHWQLNLDALRSCYRLVIGELPGHGSAAACTEPARLHPDALADTLETARQILGIDRWHICGQSLGAGITLRHALRHPHAVAAQVWTNGNRTLAPTPSMDDIADLQHRAKRIEAEGVQALRQEPFHPNKGRQFPAALRDLLAADADACDPATVAALLRHCVPRMSVRKQFAGTQVPTLLVNGRLERRFQPIRDLAQLLLPTMEVLDLPGGHAINIEQPARFEAAVLTFLARHE